MMSNEYKNAILALSGGVVLYNMKGQFELINSAACEIFHSEDEIDREFIQGILDEVGLTDLIMRSIFNSSSFSGELNFKLPGRSNIIKATWNAVVSDTGACVGAVVMLEDITTFLTEERAKKQFLSMISHELRTPIAIIKNSVSNMIAGVTGKINKRSRAYLEQMNSECERISFLINNLVDMAKIESGQMPINKEFSDVWDIIETICNEFMLIASAKKVMLFCEAAGDLPRVMLDSRRIKQVLWNLINNAIKYTPEGGKVTVRIYTNNDKLYIDVIDTGIGIDKDHQKVIFNKFYQICRKKGAGYNGSGLGLAISRGIVVAHGGKIKLHSEVGLGSTFSIELPIADDDSQDISDNKFGIPGKTMKKSKNSYVSSSEFD